MVETITAAERRELRKQRILAGNEKRLNAILNVTGEKRQKPCIEGESSIVDNTDFSPSTSSDAKPEAKTLSFLDEPPSDNLNRFIAQQADTSPKYLDTIEGYRVLINFLMGIFWAISTLYFHKIGSILIPSVLLILTYEGFVFEAKKKLIFPTNHAIMNIVSNLGVSRDKIMNICLVFNILWEIVMDLIVITFSFIISKLLIDTVLGLFA